MRTNLWRLIIVMCAIVNTALQAADPDIDMSVNWDTFLARHNVTWSELPNRWLDAPFLGNGMLGTMVFQTGEQAVRWQVGRGDVQDHRPLKYKEKWVGTMYARNRLPIGYFELKTIGKITGGKMELDLWNAEARGVIETEAGSIAWRSLVHADRMVILTELDPDEGEEKCQWEWTALPALSPRHTFRGKGMEGYEPNPDPVESRQGAISLCTQPLLVDGETVTAWTEVARGGKRLFMVTVNHTFPGKTAAKEAIGELEAAQNISMDKLTAAHRRWWHEFYPQSFVSIPDPYWEGFYWMQMYKLASGTREDRMLLDLNGPWLQRTPWPGIWWNLNVQLTYWPTYASNRLELGASLGRHIYANKQNLIDTVPEEYRHDSAAVGGATGQDLAGNVTPPNGENAPQMGLLLWGLHNCWLHYRHSMDDETLRNDLFPLLKRAVNYYFHFLTEDEDGILHIPQTFSPEYKAGKGPDTNFELALLRWGCTALIESCERLTIDDPLLPTWRNVLENLAPYPVNENGYMIAGDVPFAHRHRHFSHLLMLYPLYLVNADQEGTEELAMKSLKHWQHFGVRHGYALTGASSIASAFGYGNEALEYLRGLKRFVSKTTMYSEIGEWGQCIETPLSGAQSIHDMILQSWGGIIRVFPAAPDAWPEITFHDLRAEGGFLVSASRNDGRAQWIRIKSLAGEPCRIKPNLPDPVRISGARDFEVETRGEGVYILDLKAGEEALLYTGDTAPQPTVRAVPADIKDAVVE